MKKDIFIIITAFIVTSISFFAFIKLRTTNLDYIYKSWDGPSYVVAAESLYIPSLAVTYNSIRSNNIRSDFTYLPAHFPLYPLLIRMCSFLGYYQAMLVISLTFSLAFIISFYLLARQFKLPSPLLLTLPLIIMTPRWFLVSHTGSSEPIFLFFVIVSLLFYYRRSPWISALSASLALMARPQGALLGLAYLFISLIDLYRSRDLVSILRRYSPYLLMPLTILGIFGFYLRQTGDFWAFFKAIAIFHHFRFSLFPTFNYGAPNVDTFWQETNVLYYFAYLLTIFELMRKNKYWQLGIIGLVFYLPLVFLQHSDISRYSLPLMPLAVIAFSRLISNNKFIWGCVLSAPAIFLYALNFIANNHAP